MTSFLKNVPGKHMMMMMMPSTSSAAPATLDEEAGGPRRAAAGDDNNDKALVVLHSSNDSLVSRYSRSSAAAADDEDGTNTTASKQDSSSATTTKSSTDHAINEIKNAAMKEEEKDVRRAKYLVGLSFIACAFAMIYTVYFIAKYSDQVSFEIEYEGYAKDILALTLWEVRYNFALVEQLSASITIAHHLKNSTFPYHTEPEFEISAGYADGMGGITSIAYAPFVKGIQIKEWEQYAVENQGWIERSAYLERVNKVHRDALHGTIQDHEHDRRRHLYHQTKPGNDIEENNTEPPISSHVYRWENKTKVIESNADPEKILAPVWQSVPAASSFVNSNLLADSRIEQLYNVMVATSRAVLSPNYEIDDLFDFLFADDEKDEKEQPYGFILAPIHDEFTQPENQRAVGLVIAVTLYSNLFDRLLPEGKDGVIAVLSDSCGNNMSFELSSGKAKFLAYDDVHEAEFDTYEFYQPNLEMYDDDDKSADGLCFHDVKVYPSSKFRQGFDSNLSAIYAGVVALAFLGTAMLMFIYDRMVNRRQAKTARVAARTQAIVTSLFPKEIGERLVNEAIGDGSQSNTTKGQNKMITLYGNKNSNIGSMEGDDDDGMYLQKGFSRPMADLFPEATVMFGDIVGFTAWASTREPSQVFMLLEGLYSSFDKIAARRNVFKIETVGDCYVAVCGVPEPCKDHAVTMVRFARECLSQMHIVLHELTVALGPDTTELGIRIGLNSGPVTAGVLRGDRARFQLFGDTVNTTSRIESSGLKNQIHISEDTANLLISAGKGAWVVPRSTKIYAKGKGEMQTYWVHPSKRDEATASETLSTQSGENELSQPDPIERWHLSQGKTNTRVIEWNVELLATLLKDIIARRQAIEVRPDPRDVILDAERNILASKSTPLSEVREVIHLPKYTAQADDADPESIILSQEILQQLKDYVTGIGRLYKENPFHNFEHANHVTMSVVKLLKRIVAPMNTDQHGADDTQNLHDHTYGITSDPLTQFSVVLSALIHDADHSGVPNTQLVAEQTYTSKLYQGKSVAEQHSVDLAWELLMEDQFEDLRRAIYVTEEELHRFRQMVVQSVMATDIMDKEHNQKRKERWNKTFSECSKNTEQSQNTSSSPVPACNIDEDEAIDRDRKATIVIEHLMQASDVAHTMQHWHVYSKWNARLFKEMFKAYKEGRAPKDPTENWYEGEIGFFDYYVIPLALKLKKCGVFSVYGDEYLSYARQNRDEWKEKGKAIVEKLRKELEAS